MNNIELRKQWNNIKGRYKKTHTPQCKRCGYFSPWGNGGMDTHHIKALIDGGDNDEKNIVTLCHLCHYEWHQYWEDKKSFNEFLQDVPFHVIGAVMGAHDKFGELGCSLDDVQNGWAYIQDCIRTKQPFKDAECSEYVKKHSKDWVDW